MSQLTDQLSESAVWLRDAQDASGGWGEFAGSEHLSSLNTAEAIVGLIRADGESVGTDSIRRGVDYLRGEQTSDGQDEGAWCRRNQPTGTAVSDVLRTGAVLEALMLAGTPPDDPMVTSAVSWLLNARNGGGTWGCSRSTPARILPTCQAMLGLMAVRAQTPVDDSPEFTTMTAALADGVNLLLQNQSRSGFFSATDVASHLAAPHTIYAVLVLQRARKIGIHSDSKPERRAIDWLLASQDDARRLVSERIELAPDNGYDFLYVTDSLLIGMLHDSDRKGDREGVLYTAALYSVKDRIEPGRGACYGYRSFTWSTARAISGISAAAASLTSFPDRRAEYHARTVASGWLTAAMLALLALSTILGLTGTFSAQLAGFFSLMVFVLLFVSGKIKAPLFERLVGLALGGPARAAGSSNEGPEPGAP